MKTEIRQQDQVENCLNVINSNGLDGKSPVNSGKATPNGISPLEAPQSTKQLIVDIEYTNSEPETEKFKVTLPKDEYGLGKYKKISFILRFFSFCLF